MRLVPAALTAWAVTAAGVAWQAGPALAVVCAVAGGGWWMVRWRWGTCHRVLRASTAGVLGAAVIGVGFGLAAGLRSDAVEHHRITRGFGDSAAVVVIATESPRAAGSARLVFQADLAALGDEPAAGRVVVFGQASGFAAVSAGRPVRFRARISRPTRRDLTVAVLTAVGRPHIGQASGVQRVAAAVRQRFSAAAREVLPPGQAAMLPGLVLGDTSAVAPATTAEFRTAGLTHLTAVSGANVTIVCGTVLLTAALVGPRAAVALAALALAGFVVLVGPGASVVRAAVMGAITLLAVLSARRRQAIPALAAAVIVLMLLAPHLAVDIGFALSVSATAALAVLAPVWSRSLTGRGWPKPLADALSVAVAAQLVTAPLIAAISGRFSLVAVAANLFVAVVIPPITVLGTAAAALCPLLPAAGSLLIRFTGPELWWLLTVAHRAGGLPGAAMPVPSGWPGLLTVGCAAVAAVVLWRWRWFRRCSAAAALMVLAWSVSGVVSGA
ncbi:MAG: ComEC/Rec2 family competence protein [Mycobacterium sp.]|nr:ComEC/Rec2 family competence protein [Mycobacterium sp.]